MAIIKTQKVMELREGPDTRTANRDILNASDPLSKHADATRLGLTPDGQKSSFREKYLGVSAGRNLKNAQVSIYASCCDKWFDTVKRHDEMQGHSFRRTIVVSLFCKHCKGFFRKDMSAFCEDDEFCPHCSRQFVIPGQFEDYDEAAALEAAAQRIAETSAARVVARRER